METNLTPERARAMEGAELRWHAMIAMGAILLTDAPGTKSGLASRLYFDDSATLAAIGGPAQLYQKVSDHELAGRALAHLAAGPAWICAGANNEGEARKASWENEAGEYADAEGPDDLMAILRLVLLVHLRESESKGASSDASK